MLEHREIKVTPISQDTNTMKDKQTQREGKKVNSTFHIKATVTPPVQSGYEEEEKLKFWQDIDEMLASISEEEKLVIGIDLNTHIGIDKRVIYGIHGGWGMEARNEEEESIIDFAIAYDLAIAPTFFKKHTKLINGKAVGPDGIPVEAWKCPGDAGVDILLNQRDGEKVH
ncbi:uncharacterized protein LOC134767225 [Penaeus indicus]|uniref:uncharacterized protein LOC134767225 n=1 Tax=Penaeus indicus TaxID=29960 RepID=UPI00300DB442